MSEILLTVIIPIYNAEKFIERCITSLLKQGLDENQFEILLIDDGSTDNSWRVIEKVAKEHANIIAFHKKNGGAADARNFGFDKIKGKYIYFLDIDDYLADNSLSKIVYSMENNQLDVGYFKSLSTTALDLYQSRTTRPIDIAVMDGIEFIAKKGYQFEVWRYMINSKFFFETGLKFESGKLLEDSLFTVLLLIAAKRIGNIDLDAHRYVQEPGSIMNKPGKKHGQHILHDLELLSKQHDELINKYKSLDHPFKEKFIKRLKLKKEFFVYFAIMRFYKDGASFNDAWDMLQKAREVDAYPFKMDKLDNDPFADRIKYISNNKLMLYGLFNFVRPLATIKQKIFTN